METAAMSKLKIVHQSCSGRCGSTGYETVKIL